MKRLRADDSAATSVKVGYRQATILKTPDQDLAGGFSFVRRSNSRADWRSVNGRISEAELRTGSVSLAAPNSLRQRVASRR